MSVKVMKVIVTETEVRGDGTNLDPVRRVKQYWGFDGKLLVEDDPHGNIFEDAQALEQAAIENMELKDRLSKLDDQEQVITAQKKALEAARADIETFRTMFNETRDVFERGEIGQVVKQEDVKTEIGRMMLAVMQGYWTVKKEKVELEEKLAEALGAVGKKARTLRLRSGQAERKKKGRG